VETRRLGRTALEVPAVGMGTWQTFDVSGAIAEAERRRVVDAALDFGANLFDSSPMYGEAERVLAAALAGRRDRAIVATKIWTRSAAEGRRQVEQALAWYGGRVDVYQIHNLVAWRDHLPLLERLRDEGKVGVVGVTHYAHSAFDDLAAALRTGRFAQVQLPYNALDRAAERTLLPLAADLGVGVLAMQPLGEGALVRRTPTDAQLAPLRAFGVTTWAQALLKWILSDPRVHCAIPATRRAERMRENAAAGDPPWLDADARAYVAHLAARL
jgi:aryl-alcohol dehydrogenase-like predicted oxidoreductase